MEQKYIIDDVFFYDMRENPGWLFSDGTRISPVSTNDYELTGVSTGTIAHALGLQNGDRPRAINGHSVTTIGEMLVAYEALRTATSFNFTVSRSGNIVTIACRVDS
jgi:type II secretory pathway component PulC